MKINKESVVRHLLNTISSSIENIPPIAYKTSLETNINLKNEHIYKKYGENVNIIISSLEKNKVYSSEETKFIIKLKIANIINHAFADELGRTFWSIIYKIRE